jgi:hypothetical protein
VTSIQVLSGRPCALLTIGPVGYMGTEKEEHGTRDRLALPFYDVHAMDSDHNMGDDSNDKFLSSAHTLSNGLDLPSFPLYQAFTVPRSVHLPNGGTCLHLAL